MINLSELSEDRFWVLNTDTGNAVSKENEKRLYDYVVKQGDLAVEGLEVFFKGVWYKSCLESGDQIVSKDLQCRKPLLLDMHEEYDLYSESDT